jgi:hypothetical protein
MLLSIEYHLEPTNFNIIIIMSFIIIIVEPG